jgi:uncharacterized protein (TIGR02594 family)
MTDLLLEMLSHYGLKEVVGPQSNPEILAFFTELGYDWVNDDSTTAWCSACLSFYAKKCGYEYTGKLDARSWLRLPQPIIVLKPTIGDVVVFWRESPTGWKGHVGLFIAQDFNIIYTLGGNQSNALSISAYPRDQLLGYRQLKKIQ